MLRSVIAALVLLAGSLAHAVDSSQEINWNNLIPPERPIENPILELDEDSRFKLGAVVSYRADLRLGFFDEGSLEHKTMLKMEAELHAEGVDIDAMIAAVDEMEEEIQRRGSETVKDLDGKIVRIPGFALPLEFSDTGVTEFLLVPYVGACIHTPVPPPNQIVFVELRQTYRSHNLYDPVWITGQLKIQPSSKALTYVDGTADVATGYTIDAILVEPYE
ncbi:MAG: DUF3299 domain-containing protein [Pseudomonadota bacterium]